MRGRAATLETLGQRGFGVGLGLHLNMHSSVVRHASRYSSSSSLSLGGSARRLVRRLDRRPLARLLSSSNAWSPTLHVQPTFWLDESFVNSYAEKTPPFGFNGLGELVFIRTYSRLDESGQKRERWHETVARVVNGTYQLQEHWAAASKLPWDHAAAQASAQDMYERMFRMKFLPPGRGLWGMGTKLSDPDEGLMAALNNCAFVSTQDIEQSNPAEPFCFLMDAAMLGVGVGFDTLGAGNFTLNAPDASVAPDVVVIPDSREGWVNSLKRLIESYAIPGCAPVKFDYTRIRPAGVPIKGFGGVSSGPGPLEDLHNDLREHLDAAAGSPISVTLIVDIMNLVGKCVVSGNVRRTAEIAFGDPDSDEFLALKDYEAKPERAAYGWTSNNSIFATLGMDYSRVCEKIGINGEPGLAWLSNMRDYGRMGDPKDFADHRAAGGNPCLEQTLESYELCTLVETFPQAHADLDDYLATLRSAALYAKTVTLGRTHWEKSNRVMLRNRRIGCSMSGLAQFTAQRGIEELRKWCEAGYEEMKRADEEISEQFSVPRSIKLTSVKPSGTVSLLSGATPGIHHPESRFYIRRVRIAANSDLVPPLVDAGYHVEPATTDPETTVVVSVPIDAGEDVRTTSDVSMWEQLANAAFMQRHWADNQVSCTVTFDPQTEGASIEAALNFYQYHLKGISFLPKVDHGAYDQMPYEEITEKAYLDASAKLTPVNFGTLYGPSQPYVRGSSDASTTNPKRSSSPGATVNDPSYGKTIPDAFCDGDSCTIER